MSRSGHRSLVIGIGNPLRSDDGVGWLLAEEVGGRCVQQLTPELATELAAVDRVLFVDAWLPSRPEPAVPRLLSLPEEAVAAGPPDLSHHLEPAALLRMAGLLFAVRPAAWQLLLPAACLGHGTAFSPSLTAQLPQARALLRRWLRREATSDA